MQPIKKHLFVMNFLVKELGLLNNNNNINQTYKQVSNSNININTNSNILKSTSINLLLVLIMPTRYHTSYLNFTRHQQKPGLLLLLETVL